jgi:hypothetical protein
MTDDTSAEQFRVLHVDDDAGVRDLCVHQRAEP